MSEDGFPYCIPLLYLWMDGELYLHTTSARGHLRANIERDPRVCFEMDAPEGVFDYGRFECDSGLAYRSVCCSAGYGSSKTSKPSSGSAKR